MIIWPTPPAPTRSGRSGGTGSIYRSAPDATGYGQDSDDVAAVRVSGELLDGYHAAVHEATLRYLDRLDAAELERVVDTHWDPPVTVSVRLVSVIGDCLQHLGQAALIRGVADRAGRRLTDPAQVRAKGGASITRVGVMIRRTGRSQGWAGS